MEREYVSQGEPGIFLRKHDVIKIGPQQKGNILHIVQPTMSSTLGVYDRYSTPDSYIHVSGIIYYVYY